MERKTDGYFVGSNLPINPKLVKEETDFDVRNMSNTANARHLRWEQLMAEYKGKIDVAAAQRFLADHYDTFEKKDDADERTLCGHIELSPRGDPSWQPPYGTAGAVQNKWRTRPWRSTCRSLRRRDTPAESTSKRRSTWRTSGIFVGEIFAARYGCVSLDDVLHRTISAVARRPLECGSSSYRFLISYEEVGYMIHGLKGGSCCYRSPKRA